MKQPIPPVDSPPLTIEEYHAFRRKEEAQERERIRKLRDEWNKHCQELRQMELKKESPAKDASLNL